jgi:hypothetical protein
MRPFSFVATAMRRITRMSHGFVIHAFCCAKRTPEAHGSNRLTCSATQPFLNFAEDEGIHATVLGGGKIELDDQSRRAPCVFA